MAVSVAQPAPLRASPPRIAQRRSHEFVLWCPPSLRAQPRLVIGTYTPSGGFDASTCASFALEPVPGEPGLWSLPARRCGLADGAVVGYWFEVADGDATLLMTDPMAWAVDRANPAPPPRSSDGYTVGAPAAVARWRYARLEPSDPIPGADVAEPQGWRARLPTNAALVIYELPTRWVKAGGVAGGATIGVGTFQDVLALVSPDDDSPQYAAIPALADREHLVELGVTALELLPPADSPQRSEWGYGTANCFAADFDLGRPDGEPRSSATTALRRLIAACHARGIRFIQDSVMAFAVEHPYLWIGPDAFFGGGTPFGGRFWNFHGAATIGADPLADGARSMHPAAEHHLVCVAHWLAFFAIDGVRLDYVAGIDDWDFVRRYRDYARSTWRSLGGSDDRFWVVGEELAQSALLASSGTADASWDETFKRYARQLCVGVLPDGRGFGDALTWMLDARRRGFGDLTQVVNYLGSHDLTNDAFSDRFWNWLDARGVVFKQRHVQLAFAFLLTAVGVPMILAGDEFVDQRDLPLTDEDKQLNPVDYARFSDPWRREVFAYVARLIRQRTRAAPFLRDELALIHIDETDGRRVAAWVRGVGDDLAVVVANCSDFASDGGLAGEYAVPGWPLPDAAWFEVSQADAPRRVATPGREPLFPWEAKIYLTRPR